MVSERKQCLYRIYISQFFLIIFLINCSVIDGKYIESTKVNSTNCNEYKCNKYKIDTKFNTLTRLSRVLLGSFFIFNIRQVTGQAITECPFTIKQISSSNKHSCIVTDYNNLLKCWGYNSYGELGYEDSEYRGDDSGEMGNYLEFVDLGTDQFGNNYTVSEISSGSRKQHTCVILNNGGVKCWGKGGSGRLGYGDTNDRGNSEGDMGNNLPFVDLGSDSFGIDYTAIKISAGNDYTCAILNSGGVKCWGNGDNGRLGYGDTSDRGNSEGDMGNNLPFVDLGSDSFGVDYIAIAISAGDDHVCVILNNVGVKCWGRGDNGRLGYGDTSDRGNSGSEMGNNLPFVDLGSDSFGVDYTAIKISSGDDSTCAILNNGGVKCWGKGSYGQLGYGDTYDRGNSGGEMGNDLPFVDLGSDSFGVDYTAIDISAGNDFACVILNNGGAKCWGKGGYGQLGYGDTYNRGNYGGEMGNNLPFVDLGSNSTGIDYTVMEISAGSQHVCAILNSRGVKCWGKGAYGQLGYGDTYYRGNSGGEMGNNLPFVDIGTSSYVCPTTSPTFNPSDSPTPLPTFNPSDMPTISPTLNPSYFPTLSPSNQPTNKPTLSPSDQPTYHPTLSPSDVPTTSPTFNPSYFPTNFPTLNPSKTPTIQPTVNPSNIPTPLPTLSPSDIPTISPTFNPSYFPTNFPTLNPSKTPTIQPTLNPSDVPTPLPTFNPSDIPTTSPTFNPSYFPTLSPSNHPTESPTNKPTLSPSDQPTYHPTLSPSDIPTISPTFNPSYFPTLSPSNQPTESPTNKPTLSPSDQPTYHPTLSPSDIPTISPTFNPSYFPTNFPTFNPSKTPTTSPTFNPSYFPTNFPTFNPSKTPTTSPTLNPSDIPTISPTLNPSNVPTISPTPLPTFNPSDKPMTSPTFNPSYFPTNFPTLNPSKTPTIQPTLNPSDTPTTSPTLNPSNVPTISPTLNPTKDPSDSPTSLLSISPTLIPSIYPSSSPTLYPSRHPSWSPTKFPTKTPSAASPTKLPSGYPTRNPSNNPTKFPSVSPTRYPTIEPSTDPTRIPTKIPTDHPTTDPTENPTHGLWWTMPPSPNPTKHPSVWWGGDSTSKTPTRTPSSIPSKTPTKIPTGHPTGYPTLPPSDGPTYSPTKNPTQSPSDHPTDSPTKNPTQSPSDHPTDSPTKNPTQSPSDHPTNSPSDRPTLSPTDRPTPHPTDRPTEYPTPRPTRIPTGRPTPHPTDRPTPHPTDRPTEYPTPRPTDRPTPHPTDRPTLSPTDRPTLSPTDRPTPHPTDRPTLSPTDRPTLSPTDRPTDSPSDRPTEHPTPRPTRIPTESPTPHPTKVPTTDCPYFLNLYLGIDSSGSIGPSDFLVGKLWLQEIVDKLNTQITRTGINVFSTTTEEILNLDYYNRTYLKSVIDNEVTYIGDWTNTEQLLVDGIFAFSLFPGEINTILLITDGVPCLSNSNCDIDLCHYESLLLNLGIRIIIVEIGDDASGNSLLDCLAQSPEDIIMAESYGIEDLRNISTTLIDTLCNTLSPVAVPTIFPTVAPVLTPTFNPTNSLTNEPTNKPTLSPNDRPTDHPTLLLSDHPTYSPTSNPTRINSDICISDGCLNGTEVSTETGLNSNGLPYITYTFTKGSERGKCDVSDFIFQQLPCMHICTSFNELNITGCATEVSKEFGSCDADLFPNITSPVKIEMDDPCDEFSVTIVAPQALTMSGEYYLGLNGGQDCIQCKVSNGFICPDNFTSTNITRRRMSHCDENGGYRIGSSSSESSSESSEEDGRSFGEKMEDAFNAPSEGWGIAWFVIVLTLGIILTMILLCLLLRFCGRQYNKKGGTMYNRTIRNLEMEELEGSMVRDEYDTII